MEHIYSFYLVHEEEEGKLIINLSWIDGIGRRGGRIEGLRRWRVKR